MLWAQGDSTLTNVALVVALPHVAPALKQIWGKEQGEKQCTKKQVQLESKQVVGNVGDRQGEKVPLGCIRPTECAALSPVWAAARDTFIALFPTSSCCIYNKLTCSKQQLIARGKLNNLMNLSRVSMDIVICLWDASKWKKGPVPIACCPDWLAATSITQKLMCKTHTQNKKKKKRSKRKQKQKKKNPPALFQRD